MKNNFLKYFVITFIAATLICGYFYLNKKEDKVVIVEQEYAETNQNKIREIRVGISDVDTLNPLYSKNTHVQNITKILYEPLFEIDEEFNLESKLATEFAKVNSKEYIVKIRENVKWSNGERLTAEDVVFTYTELSNMDSIYINNIKNIKEVQKVDDYTVKFILSKEEAFFEYNLNVPIMSNTYYHGKDFSDKSIIPVSSGMYAVSEIKTSSIVLEPNTNYWNRDLELSLSCVYINRYQTIGEVYNSFKLGNTDVLTTTNENLKEYIGEIGHNFQEIKSRTQDVLVFNTQSELASNVEVRQAIASMIDKNSIALNVYKNNVITSNFPLDYGSYLYDTSSEVNKYDTSKASEILSDAGWKKQSNVWQKDSNKLEINMLVKLTDSTKKKVAENIKVQLEKEGIVVNIIDSDETYYDLLSAKEFDIALCTVDLGVSPNMDLFFGDGNLAGYTNSEVTELMTKAKNTSDKEELIEIYSKLNTKYISEVPYISLCNTKQVVVYSKALVGEFKPTWYNSYNKIESWYK